MRLRLRVVRLSRRAPSDFSSYATSLLTIDFDKPSRRAASEKLLASATRAKIAIPTRFLISPPTGAMVSCFEVGDLPVMRPVPFGIPSCQRLSYKHDGSKGGVSGSALDGS